MSKTKLLSLIFIFAAVATLPPAASADSQTFYPPAEKGSIYIVITHKKSFPPMKTKVAIKWGSWSRSGSFDAAGWRYSREGFIIRLDHKKADSIPLTVNTDGYIVSIRQGQPPSQKGNNLWEYAEW